MACSRAEPASRPTIRRRPKKRDEGTAITDDDREAARILKGRKKKSRKVVVLPLWQRRWVKATALALGLLAIGAGVIFAVKSPPPEKMYAAIENATTPDARKEAVEKYMAAYGKRTDELTEKVKAKHRELLVAEREAQLANRFSRGGGFSKPEEKDDPEAYNAAWQAMESEKAGNFQTAADYWGRVKARFPDATDAPNALWTWIAEKRLRDIKTARDEFPKVQAKVLSNRQYEIAASGDATNPEALALRGARLDEFGDREKAALVWESLAMLAEKKAEMRVWYLIACQQRAGAPKETAAEAAKARVALLQRKVEAVEKLQNEAKGQSDNGRALLSVRGQCRDIFELYEDEPSKDIIELVKKARAVGDEVPKG